MMKLLVTLASIALLAAGAAGSPTGRTTGDPIHAADHYLVKSLPQVDFKIPKSWAGSVRVGQGEGADGYSDDSLFFWLWEAETQQGKDDLIIWFNGGPACSSLLGLFKIHGPVTFPGAATKPQRNPYSWTRGANVLYVDQPVGTGFSTGSTTTTFDYYHVSSVISWLVNFFIIFPEMRNKKIHLMGESYAGMFLPNIAAEIEVGRVFLGFNLTSLSLGDAFWGNWVAMNNAVALPFIDAHRSNGTNIDPDMYQVLQQGDIDCGFPAVRDQITYPPSGPIYIPGNPSGANFKRHVPPPPEYLTESCDFGGGGTNTTERLAYIMDHTTCYGVCNPYDAALNHYYSLPDREFLSHNVKENGTNGLYSDNAYIDYLNRDDVKTAIHAPPITFSACNSPLGNSISIAAKAEKPLPAAYQKIPYIIDGGVKVHISSGLLDLVIPSLGQELVLQNTTWAGAQGFSKPPTSDVLHGKSGKILARGREERGLSYYTFPEAGHRIAQDEPEGALKWLKKVVLEERNRWAYDEGSGKWLLDYDE